MTAPESGGASVGTAGTRQPSRATAARRKAGKTSALSLGAGLPWASAWRGKLNPSSSAARRSRACRRRLKLGSGSGRHLTPAFSCERHGRRGRLHLILLHPSRAFNLMPVALVGCNALLGRCRPLAPRSPLPRRWPPGRRSASQPRLRLPRPPLAATHGGCLPGRTARCRGRHPVAISARAAAAHRQPLAGRPSLAQPDAGRETGGGTLLPGHHLMPGAGGRGARSVADCGATLSLFPAAA